ncbi:MAG: peptidoglycan bridge formation glycyltransferase FemA/FemB family protein [Chloroflexia bacterium]|nr:peptidoglycan bridge formation glycyltransferase FemA/FemB family protein [Chloroflexia bacterium]
MNLPLGSEIALISEQQRADWDRFVAGHPQGHLLQSFAWGELKNAFGWEPLRLALLRQGQIQAAAQVLFRRLPLVSLAYVPRGPLLDWQDRAVTAAMLQAIAKAARSRRGIFLKIEPNRPDEPALHERLRGLGLRVGRCVQPRSSMLVDLRGSEEDLLASFKSKTRYNVRLAGRRGVTVRTAQSPADVNLFYEMLRETATRDAFGVHNQSYYQDFYRLFNQAGHGTLLFAEHQGQILAALWAAACGPEAIYMYGASRSEGQRHMPTYLLQWEAIRWAREQGCSRYDLWGIPDSIAQGQDERETLNEKNVRDGLWGVYRFKQGFGGEMVRTVGAYDHPYQRGLYWLYRQTLGCH